MKHEELIERLQGLDGPDREVDALVFAAAGTHVFEKRGRDRKHWWYPIDGEWFRRTDKVPRYTASIDAALTLVPEGWRPIISQHIVPNDHWRTTLQWWEKQVQSRASTPATAIVIAALRAQEITDGQ